MSIKIVITDDHAVVRKGLQLFLSTHSDLELIGEASNGAEAIRIVEEKKPDIILMDLRMPVMDGIETTRRIKKIDEKIKVIVMTSYNDQDHVLPAIRAGAKGYLLKDADPGEITEAIYKVHAGEVVLHPDATGLLVNHIAESPGQGKLSLNREGNVSPAEPTATKEQLTPREVDVLRYLAKGKSNKEIAEDLFITEKTVKTHVSHILDKLGVGDRTGAAIYALTHEMFDKHPGR
ncbi:response regulator transcription factor [Paenibacillus sp. Marseille-Q4541]|uniref:response regulator n=1 Tax=Paenibacillus sp. Marseille-Q4541 TaxID=2831522 RepID=UPI002018B0DA|nr:response regulator transcription factor [Paenibacillus sp. Marseille-Q4541]